MCCLSHNDITRRVLSAGARGASSLSEPIPISHMEICSWITSSHGELGAGVVLAKQPQQFRHSCKLSKCTALKSAQRSACSLHHPAGISCGSCSVLQLNSRCLAQNLRGVLGSGEVLGVCPRLRTQVLVILHEVHLPHGLVLISVNL